MNQNDWKILDRNKAQDVLDVMSHNRDAIVFDRQLTEVAVKPLSFYNKYKLYRLTNYATLPVFTMKYLGDGDTFYTVDGLANTIYTVNEADQVTVKRSNVLEYLTFFFSNVQGSEGDVFLVQDPKNIPLADSLSPTVRQAIASHFIPVTVETTSNTTLRVTAALIYGDALIRAELRVNIDGKIMFEDQKLLMSGIHLPVSIYEHYHNYAEA